MRFARKISQRRSKLRESTSAERLSRISRFVNADVISSAFLWLLFVIAAAAILSPESILEKQYAHTAPTVVAVVLVCIAAAFYIYHYQNRIIKNHARAFALIGLFVPLLAIAKIGFFSGQSAWASGSTVTAAIILTIAYDQRFAIGMSIFYAVLACFAAGAAMNMALFLTMGAGIITCCFALREIRTRMKLLEVSALAATAVFVTATTLGFLSGVGAVSQVLRNAGWHALAAICVGVVIQSILPLIEKTFRIATSMTLLDYSDANQPLLKKLAMEAPGTYSHSLMIGSIAEAAAESVGGNGLLCRVGAYYHDIGKINKPNYFVENEMGSASRHRELSPAMSQLIIVAHVKDGIEMAREYGLPAVLRQFIETHHGTTLVEYFYNEALKKSNGRQAAPSESEFRYLGPKPQTREAAIVMLADSIEGAVRSLTEMTSTRIEVIVHNMAMKRLQDGQFDECELTLQELSRIEKSISKTLAAHYHGRVAYPRPADLSASEAGESAQPEQVEQKSS